MVRPGSSVWRSLRPMIIPIFTDDSSVEVSFQEQAQRSVACIGCLTKNQLETFD